jgi:hypothetical protein
MDVLGMVHLEDCLLLRLALRYAMFYEGTQHVFLNLLLRSVSARHYSLGMPKIGLDTSFAT